MAWPNFTIHVDLDGYGNLTAVDARTLPSDDLHALRYEADMEAAVIIDEVLAQRDTPTAE